MMKRVYKKNWSKGFATLWLFVVISGLVLASEDKFDTEKVDLTDSFRYDKDFVSVYDKILSDGDKKVYDKKSDEFKKLSGEVFLDNQVFVEKDKEEYFFSGVKLKFYEDEKSGKEIKRFTAK